MTLSAGAVARQLGISPATLRTWAHRYGIEPSARSEGSHRRYTPEDIDRLVAMQRLVRSGVSVADAAAQVRDAPPPEVPESSETPRQLGPGRVRAMWEAAQALDGQRCAAMVSESVRDAGVLSAWHHLIRPVLQRAGEQWEREQVGIEVEHLLSDAVTAGLVLDVPVRREGVLLAATGSEDHVLPLYALRAALAEAGIGAELLTARTPPRSLGDAAKRLHPAVIVLWAQLPENADLHGFDQLPGLRPKPALAAAGPGWHVATPWPHLGDLQEAVNFVRSHV
jgi:DNA-binding transcriptional MerR regulator